jgi:phosphotransferase system enzyme I (PtsI)
MIRGIGVSDGLVIGKAVIKKELKVEIVQRQVDDVDAELERLTNAVYKYTEQVEKTYNKTLNVLGEDEAAIYKNHLNVLRDSVLIGGVKKQIRDKGINAEVVLDEVKRKYETIFKRMADDFLRKKAEYIRNITEGIIKMLIDDTNHSFDDINEPVILVADELTASDTVDIDKEHVLAIVLETPNKGSHGAMLAKSWKIPAIIGVKKLLEEVHEGQQLIVDGKKGEITINPNMDAIKLVNDKLNREKELDKVYHEYIQMETKTIDGYEMAIESIVSTPDEVRFSVRSGAEHIGLFRTEKLFIGREAAPTEEEQYKVYREAVEYADGREICFRTFDCNGKSSLPYLHIPEESNPALGYSSTRIALSNRELLLAQIKAIHRASAYGRVKFVVPMVSSIDELLDIRLLIEEAKLQLEEEGIPFNKQLPFGVVLETPSVAIITNFFAQEVDFIYVDINDMLMYVTGADPSSEMVFEQYDEYHPGFIRILRSMVRSAHREGTSIAFTGRLCMNEYLIPLFVAMGIDRMSVPYKNIPKVRWEINSTVKKTWETYQNEVAQMASGREIKGYLESNYGNEFLWKNEN